MLVLKQNFTFLGWVGVILFITCPIASALLYSWQSVAISNVLRSNAVHRELMNNGYITSPRGAAGDITNYIIDARIYALLALAPLLGLVFMIIGRKFYQISPIENK